MYLSWGKQIQEAIGKHSFYPQFYLFLFSNISNVGKNWVNGQSAVLLLFSNYSLVLYHYYSERYLGNSYSGFPFVTTKHQWVYTNEIINHLSNFEYLSKSSFDHYCLRLVYGEVCPFPSRLFGKYQSAHLSMVVEHGHSQHYYHPKHIVTKDKKLRN